MATERKSAKKAARPSNASEGQAVGKTIDLMDALKKSLAQRPSVPSIAASGAIDDPEIEPAPAPDVTTRSRVTFTLEVSFVYDGEGLADTADLLFDLVSAVDAQPGVSETVVQVKGSRTEPLP